MKDRFLKIYKLTPLYDIISAFPMIANQDPVIEQVQKKLPKKFPKEISEPIFLGMRKAKRLLS